MALPGRRVQHSGSQQAQSQVAESQTYLTSNGRRRRAKMLTQRVAKVVGVIPYVSA